MSEITIFCKSYRNDLNRAAQLVASVRRFNRTSLPLIISVPHVDLSIFKNNIGTDYVQWLIDEDIISTNTEINIENYRMLPGQLSQQIVKAEFWRVNPFSTYLCVDSDSIFIRDFDKTDFLSSSNIPYTIMHEGKSFREFCISNGLFSAIKEFEDIQGKFRQLFLRDGPMYNFGPFPVAWHRSVWKDLADNFLKPRKMTILDAIRLYPCEALWYGEALLKYSSIQLMPREPFFKAYLYLEEYEHDKKRGVTTEILQSIYCGIVHQSNWYPKRLKLLKKWAYKFKKQVKHLTNNDKIIVQQNLLSANNDMPVRPYHNVEEGSLHT